MKNTASEAELKKAITSTLRRQHLFGAVPPAHRILHLTAFAAGDFIASRTLSGDNMVEDLLCGKDTVNTPLSVPLDSNCALGSMQQQQRQEFPTNPEMKSVCKACLVLPQHSLLHAQISSENISSGDSMVRQPANEAEKDTGQNKS